MPDVSRLLKINMAAVKPEVDCISGTGRCQRNSNGYPDIFDHAHFKGVTPTMPDVSRLLKINMASVKPEVDCISGTGRYQRNSNGYPDIFDHAHFKGVTPTMPDVSRLLKINMAASNRKLIVSPELYQQSQSVI
jgi:hypothetical protein